MPLRGDGAGCQVEGGGCAQKQEHRGKLVENRNEGQGSREMERAWEGAKRRALSRVEGELRKVPCSREMRMWRPRPGANRKSLLNKLTVSVWDAGN